MNDTNTINNLFLKTLQVLLQNRDGIVVNVNDELREQFPFEKVIVYNLEGNIMVIEESKGLLEGQRLYIH